MNKKLIGWSIVVALAGFLFGFDTVVISGADKQLQALWQTSNQFHGLVVMSMALWGTVVGALFGSIPTDKLGRKKTLFWIGVLYFVSAVGSAMVSDPYFFSFFRFIGGLGVGASTIAAPAFVSEIAPAKNRGKLVALYQFNIVFGILIAFISNFLLQNIGESPWRFMIGAEAVPALIYLVLVLRIPNSPRWLMIYQNDREGAKKVLQQINPEENIDQILDQMVEEENNRPKSEGILNRKYTKLVLFAFMIAFFNQLSGINAFLYYAPRIFEEAGLGASTALLSSIGIGVTNLIFTMLGLYLIDRVGRKVLMYLGSVGYIVSLTLVAIAFFEGWQGIFVPAFLFLFIAAHAIGQGTVIWVFLSEIFPNHLRAIGTSIGTSTHWVLAALITVFLPVVLAKVGGGYVFIFFAFMMVLQLLWVFFFMPETKGVSLEDLQKKLVK